MAIDFFTIIKVIKIVSVAVAWAMALSVMVMFMVWMERKVSAHMQSRLGPMRVGRHGWLQLIADAVKLLSKENVVPAATDRSVFFVAPVLIIAAAIASYVAIPIGKNLIAQDLNIGVFYILAITSLTVISIITAGWASNNKWSLLGGMRSAALIISYEVPLILSLLGVILMTGSLRMGDIVENQRGFWFIFPRWNIIPQFLGFCLYITAAVAETNRTPFDFAEAESELVAGYHTEYSGMKFAMFFFAEYINVFTVSAIATTLFLGGWLGPFGNFIPGWVWFLAKTLLIVFIIMWFRWTFPRVRIDQMMEFGWKVLTPLAFLNLLLTGLCLL